MIIANVGSMGTGKTSSILNMYCYLYLEIAGFKRHLYTALFDKKHLEENTMFDTAYNGPQVSSRIHKGQKAELIDEKTTFENIKTSSDIVFIDEFQFIKDQQFQILKQKYKMGSLIYLSVLNRSFSDYIWPQTKKICNEADFVYVLEGDNIKKDQDIETNYMHIDKKYDLVYRNEPSTGFGGCTYEYWYLESAKFLQRQLQDNNGDVIEMIERENSLLQPLLRLYDLWKYKIIKY